MIPDRFLRRGRERTVVSPNERLVLREIWRQPMISRAELLSRLPFTQQSLYRIAENLSERGLIKVGSPKPAAGRGQPSPTLLLDGDWAFTIGLALNTDNIGVTVMSLSVEQTTTTIDTVGLTRAQVLDRTDQRIKEMLAARGLTRSGLFGVGFGISGYRVEGTAFNAPTPLHEWSLVQLGPLLTRRFEAPVWTENAANTGAICEAMLGVGRYVQSFAYLSFNYGFGGALIVNGELLTGAFGNAGEFSGLYREEEMDRRPALKPLMDRLAATGIHLSSIQHLYKSFDPTWPAVEAWVEDVRPAYNRIINAICAVVDPQMIVFGGQIPPKLAEMLIGKTRIYHSERSRYGVPRQHAKLVMSELSGNPSAVGAAVLPFKAAML